MTYGGLTIAAFADAVGSRSPAQASGSAAAVCAALAASLAELTARFSDDDAARDEAIALRDRLLALADEDAAAYDELVRTKSPAAKERTIDVPLALAETAGAVAGLADRLAREGNPRLVGDAEAAATLARASARVGARLVELNVGGADDPRAARARELASP